MGSSFMNGRKTRHAEETLPSAAARLREASAAPGYAAR